MDIINFITDIDIDIKTIIIILTGGGVTFFTIGYIFIYYILLGNKSIEFIANNIDLLIDRLQKKDKLKGRNIRNKLIYLSDRIKFRLRENDGIN